VDKIEYRIGEYRIGTGQLAMQQGILQVNVASLFVVGQERL